MKRLLPYILFLVSASPAAAQVIEQGSSLLTTANAIMPGCTDTDGGAGATEATASCSAMGYSGASSAVTTASSSTSGGEISAFGEASAGSIGPPATQSASANATSQATITWQMLSDTHYSMSLATSGGATAQLDAGGGALPASGVATPGFYTLSANASAFAQALDADGVVTVTVGPRSASARVRFAAVGSPTLILGTVSAGGIGAPGLLVEALDGAAVVASTLTGDDGSYLLPDLPGPVAIRASDPAGEFATQVSSPQTPPATFDADLAPAVPALPGAFPAALGLALLAGAALRLRARRRRASGSGRIRLA